MYVEGNNCSYDGQVDRKNRPCGIGRAVDKYGKSYYGTWLDRKRHGIRKFLPNNSLTTIIEIESWKSEY